MKNLKNAEKFFECQGLYGYYHGTSSVWYQKRKLDIFRFIISENGNLDQAPDVFYCEELGVVMKKYHGYNYLILDNVEVFRNGSLKERLCFDFVIQQIFKDEEIFPMNSRY
ncbi:hypothetical protein EYV94_18455 [Puteibacter caeruleilacunae]|nr:hypothetical protein EYV94_18455 [Puteibacter caeruleilacunae]